jgi:hypothetical protein
MVRGNSKVAKSINGGAVNYRVGLSVRVPGSPIESAAYLLADRGENVTLETSVQD